MKNYFWNSLSSDSREINHKLVFIVFVFVFLTTFPKYVELLSDPNLAKTYSYYFKKIADPLQPTNELSTDTHGSKVVFRLTVPLIGKSLGLDVEKSGSNMMWLYIIQSALLYPFIYILVHVCLRFADQISSWTFVWACACTYLCKAFFWDYDFWFDGYAYFFILSAIYFRNPLLIFMALQLAFWTDERAVIALPGIVLFHLLQLNNFNIPGPKMELLKQLFKPQIYVCVLAIIAYGLARMLLTVQFDLHTPLGKNEGVSPALIPFQIENRFLGVFLSFEGLWILFFCALYIISRRNNAIFLTSLGIIIVQIIVAYSVYDITRSLIYAFPMMLVSFAIYFKNKGVLQGDYLPVACILCVFIPTHYLIFMPQQIPMTVFSIPHLLESLQRAVWFN
ncbi:hypothetical protein ASG33_16260 [Dyadobacter sp. Leaf189]|nr:hypothetical protein ASG33_16260 [Dyadobacter sp. Leaf189]